MTHVTLKSLDSLCRTTKLGVMGELYANSNQPGNCNCESSVCPNCAGAEACTNRANLNLMVQYIGPVCDKCFGHYEEAGYAMEED